MVITLTWQSIITAGGVVAALVTMVTLLVKFVRWVDHQKEQDKKLEELKQKHEADNETIQKELTLLTYGILACLKGLKEQGCNGPVTKAIEKIEKHINNKAHHQEVHEHENES